MEGDSEIEFNVDIPKTNKIDHKKHLCSRYTFNFSLLAFSTTQKALFPSCTASKLLKPHPPFYWILKKWDKNFIILRSRGYGFNTLILKNKNNLKPVEITEFLLFQKSKQKTLFSLLDWRKRQHTNGQAKISYARGLPHKKSIINLPDPFSKHSTSSIAYFISASLSFLFLLHSFPTQKKTVKGTLPQVSSSWSLYSNTSFFPTETG